MDKKDNVSDERNELETSGYGLLNLRSSYEWKQVRIDIGVENAFDKLYDDPLDGPGRNHDWNKPKQAVCSMGSFSPWYGTYDLCRGELLVLNRKFSDSVIQLH